jgi:hypothetical protein
MQTPLRKRISDGFNKVYKADNIPEQMTAAADLADKRGFTPNDQTTLTTYMNKYSNTAPTSHNRSEGFRPGRGGKRCRRTCRKRILNKNMKPMHKSMHKSMHRGRCGKRRSFRKY